MKRIQELERRFQNEINFVWLRINDFDKYDQRPIKVERDIETETQIP